MQPSIPLLFVPGSALEMGKAPAITRGLFRVCGLRGGRAADGIGTVGSFPLNW